MDATKTDTPPSPAELEEIISRGPIIVFDALCVMCCTNAQFVMRHDHQRRFRLASMQGPVGMALYRRNGIDPADPETMIVVERQSLLRNSDAILGIYARLGWPWRFAGVLKVVPRFIRDPLYRLIARHRHVLFGRHETCWLPEADDRDRLL
ncbi:thiol-disulfide oxidoreductase DCC family protein [Phyllobacterium myrsinacearum]|uniref:Putative DCC family thiol-disulfide oxidoreductase YuxK n=1 Tax=Phyllobacterium myrsinacearum TaxID=28101 RepID=A0A839EME9_9HYPH|nr:DCC1-like thiol-disulfide oxidoreductase family protein [Phyllobacterium myrsinacearum]MBA8881241.1 putative DCC family thiol-disulfide oxidoreductase YuxK [Phyllobacterium myrsinacearum]